MGRYSRTLLALGLGWLLLHGASSASDHPSTRVPLCPPGHTLVEETIIKEVVRTTCKYVTETKKVRKTIYECKEEPFCLPKCSHCALLGHKSHCGDCGPCEALRMRRVLIKREVVEEVPVCRCVIETVVDKVPVKVYRPVPCAPAQPSMMPVTPPPAIK